MLGKIEYDTLKWVKPVELHPKIECHPPSHPLPP